VGGRGILLEPGFQGVDALLELTQCIAYSAQIGLHGRRGLVPVKWLYSSGHTEPRAIVTLERCVR
jgi:hypothetical protein